ncbi:GNAT family N-acetyltransferase [Olsenella sp. YH-ols2217]|uniref:GNAT family N-acetyltransferase n=1 Tax=Kribbibacterium absianum TaxID=3044210 RepID=A0ABT6ZMK2_9ACTN|nr:MULTISPECIES: GNAT family N-acetyltransferase [unclassified Olsenella]MDJ1121858.1 GNAT family N-acetyltransferase [Olsenella sp. YH-ols2216]MDJ1129866.1 GNAT family N-acetyltransferase [Olsenella sp. YH-ols2217]
MDIIELHESPDRAHWLAELQRCDWSAGQHLAEMVAEGALGAVLGEGTRILMLVDGERLVSFCTLAPQDDIRPTDLGPWVGYVYTSPDYRGRGCMGRLLGEAERRAKMAGAARTHISTGHVGLYEKHGYRLLTTMPNVKGEESRVYVKDL